MKLFFATDFHGSDICFRKFLRTPEFYGVDSLFLGGDWSSKSLVMCVQKKHGWIVTIGNEQVELSTHAEFMQFRTNCWNRGQLVQELTEDEFHAAQGNAELRNKLYELALRDLLHRWEKLAHDQLAGKQISIYHIPGNDDSPYCDEFFKNSLFVPLDRRHVQIEENLAVLGLGGSNTTPWRTPREYDEEQIDQLIQSSLCPKLMDIPLIFFIHPPPFKSGLDDAPALNKDLSYKLILGSVQKQAVGSQSVRHAVERLQPILGLFGHIHEARGYTMIGKTLCVNPGSTYYSGRLQGCIVTIKNGLVTDYQLTEG